MDLALDDSGDLDLTGGELRLVSGVEAVRQHIRIRLRTVLGEWFLDQRIGVPYFEHILVKNPNPVLVRSIIRETILGTPGVSSVSRLEFELDRVTRKLTVDGAAVGDDGTPFDFAFRDQPLGIG